MDLWLQTRRDGVIGLVAEEADLVTALGLAMELSHPLQDCLYLALAERLGAPLVTADKKFVVKAHTSHAPGAGALIHRRPAPQVAPGSGSCPAPGRTVRSSPTAPPL